jgi:hypothetical protein
LFKKNFLGSWDSQLSESDDDKTVLVQLQPSQRSQFLGFAALMMTRQCWCNYNSQFIGFAEALDLQ